MKRLTPLIALLLVALTGCSMSTEPDQVGLEYNAGAFTSTSFDSCVGSGTRAWHGPGDQAYAYPSGQRTYDFTGKGEAESRPISVTDKDGVTLAVPGILTFSLNDQCDMLRTFHEEIGLKYGASKADGWGRLLQAYLGNPLDKAMDQASQKYTWRQMLQDQSIRDAWDDEVGRLARQFAKDQAGQDFFCAPSYAGKGACGDFALTLQKPNLPEAIAAALAETAAEIELRNKAENAAARIDVEAESLKALVDVLGPNGAVLYQAIKDGKVSVVPVPAGANINVNPR